MGIPRPLVAKTFFSSKNAHSYDKLVRLTTFGKDSIWKKNVATLLSHDDRYILDLACGTGILSSYIPKQVGRLIVGSDLTRDYLLIAKNRGTYLLLTNSVAEFLPYRTGIFDTIISSYLAKYVDLRQVVNEHWRILNNGGVAIFHDFTLPKRPVIQNLWKFYFKILYISGIFLRNWKNVFSNLDKVIIGSEWVADLMRELRQAGFQSISCKYYTLETSAIVSAVKP